MRVRDRTGDVVGRLVVHGRAPNYRQSNGRSRVQWICICACGNEITVEAGNLNSGHTQSCGCLVGDTCAEIGAMSEHGMTGSKEFNAWLSAKSRCFNARNSNFKNYGGRGITMYAEWVDDFSAFYTHIGPCPTGSTLDRIDNDGHYEPGNVRWATRKDQARNRRNSLIVEFDGEKAPLSYFAEKLNLPYYLVYERFTRQGWSVSKSLTTPKRINNASRV